MTTLGMRSPDSVSSRLVEFFRANPAEELTIQDAAAKFSVSEAAVKMAARRLVEEGEIERVKVMRLPSRQT